MWPLLGCSVLALAVILERSAFFVRHRLRYDRFLEGLLGRLASGDAAAARQFAAQGRHPLAWVAGAFLDAPGAGVEARVEAARRQGSWQMERVERRLPVLGVICQLAPLLGLLGTVTGLVAAFHTIELKSGAVDASDLAAGIWEALLTTIFGLGIAIPCHAAYEAFAQQADKVGRRIELVISELSDATSDTVAASRS